MLWEHRLISAIFPACQLPQRCNLILPTEMPVGTAARTSAIPKWLRRNNHIRDSPGCIHYGHLMCTDATGTCNHIPAGEPLVVTPVPQLSVLHRLALFCTPEIPYASHDTPNFIVCTAPIHHTCSHPSINQASTTHVWKHASHSQSSQGLRGKDVECMSLSRFSQVRRLILSKAIAVCVCQRCFHYLFLLIWDRITTMMYDFFTT